MYDSIEGLNTAIKANAYNIEIFKERNIVFGDGNTQADYMLIGEAPGGEEDKLGKPFVGKAGKNLDEFLEVVQLDRKNIYITNLVKVRPTKISLKTNGLVNRPPDKAEIDFFLPYLLEEINIIKPKIVITLGNYPLKAVIEDKNATIGNYHGAIYNKLGYDVFPLYHPASIIYNQGLKETYNDDLLVLKSIIHSI